MKSDETLYFLFLFPFVDIILYYASIYMNAEPTITIMEWKEKKKKTIITTNNNQSSGSAYKLLQ